MGKPGLLKFEDFGVSMPVTDPFVPVPPVYPRSVEQFIVHFEADYDSVAHKLPYPLEFEGDKPSGMVVCNSIGFVTDSVPFLEAQLAFNVTFKGKPFLYLANLLVNSGEAMASGREVYGYAKKMAHMDYYTDMGQYCMTADRPRGVRIFSASVRIKRPMAPPDPAKGRDTLCLKLIPGYAKDSGPQVCQLVGIPITGAVVTGSDGMPDFWECTGSISWGSMSQDDPWHETRITKITGAAFGRSNSVLQYGYLVHDYLA
ncbi:hypothetical protein FACS1894130_04000 [Spirochaetia bacterium]|nr:hypothetical protein FACS1894130_04000 [Spirochaetia bacterium]